ncbi:MAG: YdcF family protein [Acutalibacteraceae bacterium]|nr:YdcF family protein [Clostridia bacterium]MEE3449339.1 YdcF family protein [Acutalibacteraceae bacterium]
MNSEKKLSKGQRVMTFIHIILGGIFFCLFLVFFLPILGGTLNIGNITGMMFCAVMIFVTWGNKYYTKIIDMMKTTAVGKAAVYTVYVFFILGIIYVGFVTSLLISADRTPPQKDCTVIVLGCQVRGERPSRMLYDRIKSAADFLKKNPDVPCIVTGGKGNDEHISEAECMYNELIKLGIDSERIYKEDKAVNTIENIDFSKAVIDENGFSYNTAVVTDIFHEYRASKLVKKAGLEFGSVPADCVWYLFPTFYVREVIAVTASFVGLA